MNQPYPHVPALHGTASPEYAPGARRAGAFLIDLVPTLGSCVLLANIHHLEDAWGEETVLVLGWCLAVLAVSALVLHIVCEGRGGQTVGKRLLGIRAVRDGSGQRLGVALAFGRRMAQVLNWPLLGLGWWWGLGDVKGQTFADKVTRVVVIRATATR